MVKGSCGYCGAQAERRTQWGFRRWWLHHMAEEHPERMKWRWVAKQGQRNKQRKQGRT